MRRLLRPSYVLALLALVALPSPGFAQTADAAKVSEVEELRQMVRELSARVAMLEEQARQQQRLVEADLASKSSSITSETTEPAKGSVIAVTAEPAGGPA